ncbi:unnamed protein product [Echinostoma caproni]|uniref:Uncharacterized protein n=1 Tax=Echinostoma caproni TaxID=27848 RepID=A0A183BB89_9TREM|nr:unnamed protein product [Echinostoma caproni]
MERLQDGLRSEAARQDLARHPAASLLWKQSIEHGRSTPRGQQKFAMLPATSRRTQPEEHQPDLRRCLRTSGDLPRLTEASGDRDLDLVTCRERRSPMDR